MRRLPIAFGVGIIALALAGPPAVDAQEFIKPTEAGAHVGEQRTVCGQVASATFALRSRGEPTFLNLDRPYPDHIFTVVIWEQNRPKFQAPPERLYRGKLICVMGLISTYRGVPQIVVDEPSQISLQ